MSKIPHPTVVSSVARFSALDEEERRKIRFIHLNHSNPLHDAGGVARAEVAAAGMGVSDEGDRFCL